MGTLQEGRSPAAVYGVSCPQVGGASFVVVPLSLNDRVARARSGIAPTANTKLDSNCRPAIDRNRRRVHVRPPGSHPVGGGPTRNLRAAGKRNSHVWQVPWLLGSLQS